MNQKSALQEDDLNHQAQLEFERIAIKEAVFIEYLIYPVCLFIILMTAVFLYHFSFFDKNSFSNIIANSFIFLVINFIFLNNHLREKMCFLDYSKRKRKWFIRCDIKNLYLENPDFQNRLLKILPTHQVIDVPQNKIKCISWLFVLFNLELFFICTFIENNFNDPKLIWKPDIFVNAIDFVRNNICIQGSGFFCISINLSDNFTSLSSEPKIDKDYLLKANQEFFHSDFFEASAIFYVLRLFIYIPYIMIYGIFFYDFFSTKWFNPLKIKSFKTFFRCVIIFPFMLVALWYHSLFIQSMISFSSIHLLGVVSWLFNPSISLFFGMVSIIYFFNWFILFKRLIKKYS